MSLRSTIVEAIITHPEDTFMIPDIEKQLPEGFNVQTVRVTISRDLKNLGYVKKIGQKGHYTVYKILKRTESGFEKAKDPKIPEPKGISLEQIGEAMVRHIKNLEERAKELAAGYSDLQTEYNKEIAARKLMIKEREKVVDDLREQLEVIKTRLKAKETRFSIRELTGQ